MGKNVNKHYKFRFSFVARMMAVALTGVMVVTSAEATAYAASNVPNALENGNAANIAVDNYSTEATELIDAHLEKEVQDAYAALIKAVDSGKPSDCEAATKLIDKLTPTQLARLFLIKYADYYREHFLDKDFALFNADAYIEAHPEILDNTLSKDDMRALALEYYLNYGVYKGHSSCTSFDPIVSIIAYPEENRTVLDKANVPGSEEIAAIKAAYSSREGNTNTMLYKLGSTFLTPKHNVGSYDADDGILFINRVVLPVLYNGDDCAEPAINNDITYISENRDKNNKKHSPKEPAISVGDPINKEARKKISKLVLHTTDDGADGVIDLSTDEYNITYDAERYHQISDKIELVRSVGRDKDASQAKYTVMIYMCGSNLDDLAAGDMLNIIKSQYRLDEVNVLLCTGGSLEWNSEHVNDTASTSRCSIFYLDPTNVAGAEKNINNMNESINDNSFKLLSQIDTPINMGESELLLGFMDMAYDLFPADNYMLNLWNHGGGAPVGICVGDELYMDNADGVSELVVSGDALTLANVEEALNNSKIYNYAGGVDVLTMDACLMGGIEEAYNFSRYVDYFVASPQLTTGPTAYDKYLKAIADAITASYNIEIQTGEKVKIDNAKIAIDCASSYNKDATADLLQMNSCLDLKALADANIAQSMDEVGKALDVLFDDPQTSIESYRMYRMAIVRANGLGEVEYETTNNYLFVDLYDFFSKLSAFAKEKQDYYDYVFHDGNIAENYYRLQLAINKVLDSGNYILYSDIFWNGVTVQSFKATDSDGDGKYEGASLSQVAAVPNADVWNALNLSDYSGLSISAPGLVPLLVACEDVDDGKINLLTDSTFLQGLFGNYTDVLGDKYAPFAVSDSEINREQRIIDNIAVYTEDYSKTFSDIRLDEVSYVTGGALRTDWVLYIEFENEYDSDALDKINELGMEDDVISPFDDFIEAVSAVEFIFSTDRTATYTDTDGNQASDTVKVVHGHGYIAPTNNVSSSVKYENGSLNKTDSLSFNITKGEPDGFLFEGLDINGSQRADYTVSVSNEIEEDIYKSLLGSDYDPHYFFVFKGQYYLDTNYDNPYEGFFVYNTDSYDNKNLSHYATIKNPVAQGDTYETVSNITALQLYHYIINSDASITCAEADGYDLGAPIFLNGSDTVSVTRTNIGEKMESTQSSDVSIAYEDVEVTVKPIEGYSTVTNYNSSIDTSKSIHNADIVDDNIEGGYLEVTPHAASSDLLSDMVNGSDEEKISEKKTASNTEQTETAVESIEEETPVEPVDVWDEEFVSDDLSDFIVEEEVTPVIEETYYEETENSDASYEEPSQDDNYQAYEEPSPVIDMPEYSIKEEEAVEHKSEAESCDEDAA